jgi:hypothetical protein
LSAPRWNLKIELPQSKKSAKDALFNMASKTLKLLNAPEVIDLKVYKYNVLHKLAQEIDKMSEEQAQEVIKQLKEDLSGW